MQTQIDRLWRKGRRERRKERRDEGKGNLAWEEFEVQMGFGTREGEKMFL